MKIDFRTEISGWDALHSYISRADVVEDYEIKGGLYQTLEYDLRGLEKDLVKNLGENFQENGYGVNYTSNTSLWVSCPDEFSAIVKARLPGYVSSRTCKSHMRKEDTVEFDGNTIRRPFFFKKQVPIYVSRPAVAVQGEIAYERLDGVDPTPVLSVLNTLGYEATVEPTPKEVLETMEEMKRSNKRRSSSSTSGSGEDGTLGFLAGAGVGLGLGD